MTNTTRNVLIACGVLLLVACACTAFIVLGGLSIFMTNRSTGSVVISTPNLTEIVEESPDLTTPADEFATPTIPQAKDETPGATQEVLSDDLNKEMDVIQQQVIELRGLQPDRAVERSFLTPEELRQKVVNDFLNDYTDEEASNDAIVMAAFDLLDPDFDLINFYIDLYSEQIAGFYDDETEEMYVVRGSGFQGPERLTYAHEYTHVLQDQNYDIEEGLKYTDELCESDSEHCAAIQALLEGDASLLEIMWFSVNATKDDQREIMDFYDQFNSPVYDSAPDFMQQDFLFPYQYGQEFVQSLYESGGWDAVDQVYGNLPRSTEQILHPERYPDDQPVAVSLPDFSGVLGQGWQELDRGVMGEWSTYLIIGFGLDVKARLSEEAAKSATDGWGGDAYVVYFSDDGRTAMVLKTVWDSEQEAQEFSDRFEIYAGKRFGDPTVSQPDHFAWESVQGHTDFYKAGAETTWILAPDAETASAIWESIP